MTIAILGRQPKISLAELESLYGADALQPLGEHAALLEIDHSHLAHAHIGGTIKVARLLTTIHTTKWAEIADYLTSHLSEELKGLAEGKIKIGLSTYGLHTTIKALQRVGLELKKALRASGRSVRLVPNQEIALNSAQVIHNKLTSETGVELLLIAHNGRTYIAKTTSVQDVESYSKRDFARPKRDAFVGMLPPKLAQTMLNLARPKPHGTVLDPFCGTGVVLMEAALQEYKIEGSDISQKMVDFARANLDWLGKTYHFTPQIKEISVGDATEHVWRTSVDTVVSEVYLGQPLSGLPSSQKLQEIMQNCDTITRKFLTNLHHQLATGTRICLAIPAWRVKNRFVHLKLVDDLKKLGYNRVSFSHARQTDLIYHRPDQIVARELLVLICANKEL